jgi:asparagine synthase (glutamine-hydrolysing)
MCGIAGFKAAPGPVASAHLESMLDSIRHRGPDSGGVWLDTDTGIALGHRRLSIVDLSPAGHQPMESACGRYVVTFNGEIYNHRALRRKLELEGLKPSVGWRGHSDTETLLMAISAWGLQQALSETVGMFALALWDRREARLSLARDRVGEKPLYYGWQQGNFLFASELKAIRRHPSFRATLNWDAVGSFLRLNFIPAPATIYENIFKLTPGSVLSLDQSHLRVGGTPSPVSYWSLGDVAARAADNPFRGSFAEAVDVLDSIIEDAVRLQSSADVPLGAFLSGGIDSSLVVAMLQKVTSQPVTTFSIGMPQRVMDETEHATAVATALGTDHVAHMIQPSEALALIPKLTEIWDEPFADSSQIPTFLVSQLARRRLTVALSGDGGDEFFLGYSLYHLYDRIWRLRGLGKLPWGFLQGALSPFSVFPRIGKALSQSRSIVTAWRQPNAQMLSRYWFDRYRGGPVPLREQAHLSMPSFPIVSGAASTAGLWDAGTYLPDDILTKVDRAAMANSLETRAPLLDHRVIEFALSLPERFKLEGAIGKRVLREVLYRHVPRKIVDRPKMGFSIPLGEWLRHDLRGWAHDLIDSIDESKHPLDKSAILKIWSAHLGGEVQTERLWGILSLVAFLQRS